MIGRFLQNFYDVIVDRIEVTAIYRGVPVRINPNRRTVKTVFRTYLDVLHVKKTRDDRLVIDQDLESSQLEQPYDETDEVERVDEATVQQIRELSQRPDIYEVLAQSLAPSIYEHDDVKKGLLLQLFGGANKNYGKVGAPRTRFDSFAYTL